MNLFHESKKVLDKDGKVNPLGPYGRQKLTGREVSTYFRRNKVKDPQIKKAVEVALDLQGAMTVASSEIKKFYGDKILKSKEVQKALKYANESVEYDIREDLQEVSLGNNMLRKDFPNVWASKDAKLYRVLARLISQDGFVDNMKAYKKNPKDYLNRLRDIAKNPKKYEKSFGRNFAQYINKPKPGQAYAKLPESANILDAYKDMVINEEVANITVDPRNKINSGQQQAYHGMEIAKQARRFGLKSSVMHKHVRIKGPKKKVNDFLRVVIGKSSYGDPTEKDMSTPQIDKMLTKGLK